MAKKDRDDLKLKKLINRYLRYLELERNYSVYTLRNYKYYLNFFKKWFEKKYEQEYIQRLTSEMVVGYRLYLSRREDDKGRKLSPITQSYYVIALRAFLKFLSKKGIKSLSAEKVDLPKIGNRQIKFLARDQVERLLSSPDLTTVTGLRDRTILEVLFSTGLRVSELAKLNRDKIDLKAREFGIVGKGRRSRVVFLTERAAEWLKRYLSTRNDRYEPLWIRYSGKRSEITSSGEKMRLSIRGVQRMVEKYRRIAGLPFKVSPHTLRHSTATTLLSSGANLRSVQEILGHKNVATTQIYTHITNPELKKVHEKYLK